MCIALFIQAVTTGYNRQGKAAIQLLTGAVGGMPTDEVATPTAFNLECSMNKQVCPPLWGKRGLYTLGITRLRYR